MKIVHIASHDTGGAGIAATRIHESQVSAGLNSTLLLRRKSSRKIENCESLEGQDDGFLERGASKIKNIIDKRRPIYEDDDREYAVIRRLYCESLFKLHTLELIKSADILHLHWVNRFLDQKSFFKSVRQPIVWSFHDMNPFSGGYPYQGGLAPGQIQAANRLLEYKKGILRAANLNGVATTKTFARLAAEFGLYEASKISVIPYGLDTNVFKPHDKCFSREVFGLPHSSKVLLFIAADVSMKRKGLEIVLSAQRSGALGDCLIAVVGSNFQQSDDVHNVVHLGEIHDTRLLSLAFSASDLLITPASEEAFGQTTIEAIACGTPVVSYQTAGALDIISEGVNGIIASDFSHSSFVKAVKKAMTTDFDNQAISEFARKEYSFERQANRYRELYESLAN